LSTVATQQVFAHSLRNESFTVHEKDHTIFVVLGHADEPTYGVENGIHDGRHNMEIFLSDEATGLPLKGANLKADMYYFNSIQKFNNATSPNNAQSIKTGVTVNSVYGDPGHYVIRELQSPGIYGYHIYGTMSYFGVHDQPIDTTVFCKSTRGDTSKFNSPGWFGSFGCTDDIREITFPPRSKLNN
jgi:hypothetical protein